MRSGRLSTEPQTCRLSSGTCTRLALHTRRTESCPCTFGNDGDSHLSARCRCTAGRWQEWAAPEGPLWGQPLREPLCRHLATLRPESSPAMGAPPNPPPAPCASASAFFPLLPLLSEQLLLPNSNLSSNRRERFVLIRPTGKEGRAVRVKYCRAGERRQEPQFTHARPTCLGHPGPSAPTSSPHHTRHAPT